MALLDNGCICCTVRDDLVETLTISLRGARRAIPSFDASLVETTGLADPAPILHALMAEPAVGALPRRRRGGHGRCRQRRATLDAHPEAVKQIAVADRLLVTKTDLVSMYAGAPLERAGWPPSIR